MTMISSIGVWLLGCVLVKQLTLAEELVAVTVLFRHGERAIISSYPTDPYKNESFWPVPYGELTNVGKNHHYRLGKWIRQRYTPFLSTEYLAEEFHIRSSNFDRCLMSAASNLAGLFPPVGDQVWNHELNWQPIPIHTIPNKMDGMLALQKPCPEYQRQLDELLNTDYYQKIHTVNSKLYAYLTAKTGLQIKDFIGASDLYDTLLVEDEANYTLPEWTHSVYPEMLREQAIIRFQYDTPNMEAAKFGVGQVFDRILEQFEARINGTKVPKFSALSAHDTNVFSILNTLKRPQTEMVPYAGMVIFELKKTADNKYYVNFFYKKSGDAELLTIDGCEQNCDYEKFKAIMKPLALNEEEYDRQCSIKQS